MLAKTQHSLPLLPYGNFSPPHKESINMRFVSCGKYLFLPLNILSFQDGRNLCLTEPNLFTKMGRADLKITFCMLHSSVGVNESEFSKWSFCRNLILRPGSFLGQAICKQVTISVGFYLWFNFFLRKRNHIKTTS